MQTMIRSQLILAVGLFGFPLLGSAAGNTAIPITQCGPINQPGNYHLVQDLQGGQCIDVFADNVEIHLDGFTIHAGLGIRVFSSNVSITGSGTIETVTTGVLVLGGSGIKIVDTTIRMIGDGEAAVEFQGGANAILIGNTILTDPIVLDLPDWGISLTGVQNSIIRSNTVSRFRDGIIIGASAGNLIQANTASGNIYDIVNHDACNADTWKSNTFTTSIGQCIQ